MEQATLERPQAGATVKRGSRSKSQSTGLPPISPLAQSSEFGDESVSLQLRRVRSVLWMLIRTLGGEIPESERPSDECIVCCIQYVNRVFSYISDEQRDPVRGDAATAICDGRGIASVLDAMTWSDGMQILGSDEMMSGLFDAMDACAHAALRALGADPA